MEITFGRGTLNIGEPMAVPVISQLKKWVPQGISNMVIRDAPPGTSCPVVEAVRNADFVILVTEPTPFGLHDLKLAAQLTTGMGIPSGVVINRDGVGDSGVEDFCQETDIPILMRIPLEREIGEGIAAGKNLVDIHPEYENHFLKMVEEIRDVMIVKAKLRQKSAE